MRLEDVHVEQEDEEKIKILLGGIHEFDRIKPWKN